MKWTPLWLVSLTLLASCSGSGRAIDRDYCLLSKPILVSRQDVLTKMTAQQVLAQNETFAKLCR